MSYEQVMGELKNGTFHPVYFLYGDEPYYIDLVTGYITSNALSEAEKGFNQTILYGGDTGAQQVTETARRYPMMAARQVVVVKEAQEMKDFGDLDAYMKNPLPSTLLVLNYKSAELDRRKKVFKSLEKSAVTMESKKLYDNRVPGWITTFASSRRFGIEPKAAALVAEFLGSDLSRIANELEKLMITLGDKVNKITPAHVEEHIGISKDYNQFELTNALGRKDVLKANRIVRYFADNQRDHHITPTIASIYYFFSKVLMYHYITDRSRQNVASVLKVNPYFVPEYASAARRYSKNQLVEVISLLREYDMRSKGYGGDTTSGGELLRELTFKILHL